MANLSQNELVAEMKATRERAIEYTSRAFDLRAELLKYDIGVLEEKLNDDKFNLKMAKASGVAGLVMLGAGAGLTVIATVVSIASATFVPAIFALGLFGVGVGTLTKVLNDKRRAKIEKRLQNVNKYSDKQLQKMREDLRYYEKKSEQEINKLNTLEANYKGAGKVSRLKNLSSTKISNVSAENRDR